MVRGRKSAGVSGLVSDATQFLPLHGPANSCSLRYLGSVDNYFIGKLQIFVAPLVKLACSDPFPTVAPPFAAPRRLRLPHTLGKRWFRFQCFTTKRFKKIKSGKKVFMIAFKH
ncbi:uncharacterized protein [Henckelia pumila]|uniref:uncharacterized protein isoform X2 n=1 Tax=Henckelia pumila TaxID=405737 RepID=UPI003C6E2CF9